MTADTGEMLCVGQPYPNQDLIFPNTCAFYPGSNLLLACYDRPTQAERASFGSTDGWVEFALLPMEHLLITLTRFPGQEWSDSAWANVEGWDPPDLELPVGSERYPVTAVLVDARTGIIERIRWFTLSPHYSQAYFRLVDEIMAGPVIGLNDFLIEVKAYQEAFSTKALVPMAVVRCKAGLP